MSSVLLPKWKEEPLSPLNSGEETTWLSVEDAIFYQTSPQHFNEDANDELKFDEDLVACETKAEVASIMLENLENLIDLDELIKEEPFLLDEKILPMLDEVEQARSLLSLSPSPPSKVEYVHLPPHRHHSQADTTPYLLKEFENVYDVVEFAHETLTPPQSPPSAAKPILATLEPLLVVPQPQPQSNALFAQYSTLSTPQHDIDHELAVVDELVRTRVEHMQWHSSSGPSSPNCTDESSLSSSDPDWVPETLDSYSDEVGSAVESQVSKARKRSKPYARGAPGDKKTRKKEQNKNAATRYRMKKKAEVEVILTEEKELAGQNSELGGKITDLEREIKYLKGLMRDLFKAKGLIN